MTDSNPPPPSKPPPPPPPPGVLPPPRPGTLPPPPPQVGSWLPPAAHTRTDLGVDVEQLPPPAPALRPPAWPTNTPTAISAADNPFGLTRPQPALPAATWLQYTTLVAVALLGGVAAVLGAIAAQLSAGLGGAVAAVAVAPPVEEVAKVAPVAALMWFRPQLVPKSKAAVVLTAVVSGLVFAAIENLLYLHVYIPDPSMELIAWRQVFGPAIHGGCSLLAGIGLVRTPIKQLLVRPNRWLVAAIVIHAAYNLTMTMLPPLT